MIEHELNSNDQSYNKDLGKRVMEPEGSSDHNLQIYLLEIVDFF